ncbi:MAG: M20/M25/M40 family metallo-hydrolase [Chloroflexi bacterium]|nr:M20/M25/M40 family metallo-hydrolase [Chloroflexota bacterium]MCL5074298.1 M20/M25/M40 family metallo-hydrolase [Chloroflexota bacterium]
MKELFKRLVSASGASSDEGELRTIIKEEITPFVDDLSVDRLGNLIASKKGHGTAGPVLMLTAHMDEIGLMVSSIERNGIIRFEKVGWIDDRVLPTQSVIIKTAQGAVPGVIGLPSTHAWTEEEKRRVTPFHKLFIDIGSFNKEETEQQGVCLGDMVTFVPHFMELRNGIIATKSVDDRIGLTVLIEVMKWLAHEKHEVTVVGVGLAQHEVGLRGARTAAYAVDPDVAIHIDITGNFPDDAGPQIELGKGPVVRLMEEYGSRVGFGAQIGLFSSRLISRALVSIAQKEGIPYQLQIKPGAIADGSVIHTSREGVLTCPVLIPARYNHSANELVKWDDVENTVRLLSSFVKEVTRNLVDSVHRLE